MPTKAKPTTPVYDIKSAIAGLEKLKFHKFSDFNGGSVGVFSAEKGISPWEMHPEQDEFLYVIEGETTITILNDDDESNSVKVKAGSCLVVPKGHWHRHEIAKHLVEMWVTPGKTEHSRAEDPRTNGKKKSALKSQDKPRTTKDLVAQVRAFALAFPETHEDNPWGHPAFKVKNKSFVWLSFREAGINLTVKLTHSRLMVEEMPFAEPCGYGLGQHGWITIKISTEDDTVAMDLVKRWIEESYRAVAPKAILKQLGDMPMTSDGIKRIKKPVVAHSKSARKK